MIESTSNVPAPVRSVQMVIGAMVVGVIGLTGVAVYFVEKGDFGLQSDLTTPLLFVWLALAVGAATIPRFLEGIIVAQHRNGEGQPHPEPAFGSRFGQVRLIKAALVEAPTLWAATAYMLSGKTVFLGCVVVGLVMLLRMLPSEADLAAFQQELGRPV